MGKNIPGLKRGFHWDPTTESMGIYVDGVQVVDYTAQKGRTYYVNNITGSSTGNGLSWGDAMDQPSTAISEAETYLATHTTYDTFILNNIIMQGTATAYAGITTVPSYCRFIGLGANPYGHGEGIPRIGADDHETTAEGGMEGSTGTTGDVRGMYLSGIQWQSNGTEDCFQIHDIFRTTIEDCAFFVAGEPDDQPYAGFDITGNAGGLVMRDCHWGGNARRTDRMRVGFNIASAYFQNCLVENCTIIGSYAGVFVYASLTNGHGSVFRDCYIGEGGFGGCEEGIDDEATAGMIQFQNCFINAAVPIKKANDATRFIGCIASAGYITPS